MDLKQYVADATRTESRIQSVKTNQHMLISVLRVFTAAGTMLDLIKKHAFYGKAIDEQKFDTLHRTIEESNHYLRPLPYAQHVTNANVRELDVNTRLFHAIVGTMTESAELGEALLKAIETDFDLVNVLEEFGDINWYEAIAIDELDADFQQILERNIAKLRKRFPEKYTDEKAINRDLAAERIILEGKSG